MRTKRRGILSRRSVSRVGSESRVRNVPSLFGSELLQPCGMVPRISRESVRPRQCIMALSGNPTGVVGAGLLGNGRLGATRPITTLVSFRFPFVATRRVTRRLHTSAHR